ncbi:NUDIX domain-containing protein [Streptomyces bathyalis]|uniref:NUDIX domain-containing protein n=1 Tax=Streptomyces bathyalis TaxID=2710756 RepID=A0A7T1TAI5_9ACTN|nr:NUDIX domain-containing protein [Streptomyces bathyalis]QPP09426.1 NUDIX domain-containing protein [Streptomyces bathyalis]
MDEHAETAEDGVGFDAAINGQTWHIAWHPPPDPPPGTPHGAEAVCFAGDRIVVVSRDGRRWGLPAGRPERNEQWAETMRREVREEACCEVTGCRLLGYSRGVCVRGHQKGLVLVRSMWRAEVQLEPWDPQFEMAHRRLLPAREAFRSVTVPDGLGPFHRRLFTEAGVPPSAVHDR